MGLIKFMLLVLPLMILVGLIAYAIIWLFRSEPRKQAGFPRAVPPVALGMLLVLFVSSAVGQIEAGHMGVVLEFGKVTGRVISPGLYFVLPVINTVEDMNTQTQAYETQATAASKDLQDVKTHVTLNYSLDPAKVGEVYQNLRREYVERIIKPAVQESVKAATALFDATNLITERPMVKSNIEMALRDRLGSHGIVVDTLSITNFEFSASFTAAIEAKVSAVQRAQEAQNKLVQVQIEAQQAQAKAAGEANAAIEAARGKKEASIAVSQGEAQAAIIRADGEAKAILAVADAQTKANKELADSVKGQPDYLKYFLYKQIGPDVRVILVPAGQDFILGSDVIGK